ncbi:craniofacial development protein 2-like [Penaeus monodon]|uniref:craniofacial development protein 2-like n=1 Tax=Penaeus monodon TaxID=6687 RepID=UPI0018A7C4E9|nr:craniofacial development protein 2-like [Penaeus monodon]
MLDADDSNRPERRPALIAHELSRLDVDIAALSEVRFPDVRSLQEHGTGYTLFWSGKPATERRFSGVCFMIRTSIAFKLENLPTGHSDRTMSMCLPLKNERYVTLFSVYALTLQAEPAEKDRFYLELGSHLQSIPADDKVIFLGNFNARVGQDVDAWKGVLGKHGVGNCNDNGRSLLELCTEQQLVITNTIFQQKDKLKTTWMHPRSKHWHLIDYVVVRLMDVLHTRADLQSKLESIDCPEDPSPETLWDQLKTAILQTSEEVLGFTTKRDKDCNLQHKHREIQNEWWTNLAEKTQLCADTGDYRGFYEALKAVYGPTHHVQSPLRSADGQALFSADRIVQDSAVLRIRQKPVIEELDELPSMEEISKA